MYVYSMYICIFYVYTYLHNISIYNNICNIYTYT